MPGRTIGRGLQQIAGQVADIHGQQLEQLQQTQQVQSTLALQRTLRELDQTFIQKLNNQLSLADADKPITEDWLNEDFRQQELRRMFDERMQSVRGSVSTPAGQIDFESRAEAMWQQYEHNWRDKATAALKAWNQAAIPKVLQGIIDESDLAEVDFAEAQILDVFERAVRSGTIPAEKRRAAQEAAVTQLYDTLLKGYIQDPRQDGEPPENFLQGYDWSAEKIDEMYEKGRINRAHRDELQSAAQGVREAQREQMYWAESDNVYYQIHDAAYEMAARGHYVDFNYKDFMSQVHQTEWWDLLNHEQKQKIENRVDAIIKKLNDKFSVEKDTRAVDSLDIIKEEVLETLGRSYADARALIQGEDSIVEHAIRNLSENGYYREALNLREWAQSLGDDINKWQDNPWAHNPEAARAAAQYLAERDETPHSVFGRNLGHDLIDKFDITPGRTRYITVEMVHEFFQDYWEDDLPELMDSGGLFGILPSPVQRMARPGFQHREAQTAVEAFSRSYVQDQQFKRVMDEVFSESLIESRRTGTGEIDLELLSGSVGRVLGRRLEDIENPDQLRLANSLIAGVAGLKEMLDYAGDFLLGSQGYQREFSVLNIEVNRSNQMPVYTILAHTPEGGDVIRKFQVNVTDPTAPTVTTIRRALPQDYQARRNIGDWVIMDTFDLKPLREGPRFPIDEGSTEERRTRTRPLEGLVQ